jgi:hypothetical protein
LTILRERDEVVLNDFLDIHDSISLCRLTCPREARESVALDAGVRLQFHHGVSPA